MRLRLLFKMEGNQIVFWKVLIRCSQKLSGAFLFSSLFFLLEMYDAGLPNSNTKHISSTAIVS